MSNYTALQFTYDSIPSERHKLFLISLGDVGIVSSTGGGDIEINRIFIPRQYSAYDYGISQNNPLKFDLVFGSLERLDRQEVANIQRWLVGRITPLKLQIIQPDLQILYFDCRLTDFEITSVDNVPFAFKCKVDCNQPWALENPKTKIYTPNLSTQNLVYYNNTDNNDYTKPKIEFTLIGTGTKIINNSDGGRFIQMAGLTPTETITLDSTTQMLTSSLGLLRTSKFTSSARWFRLIQGYNNITIEGALSTFKITSQNVRKVGS